MSALPAASIASYLASPWERAERRLETCVAVDTSGEDGRAHRGTEVHPPERDLRPGSLADVLADAEREGAHLGGRAGHVDRSAEQIHRISFREERPGKSGSMCDLQIDDHRAPRTPSRLSARRRPGKPRDPSGTAIGRSTYHRHVGATDEQRAVTPRRIVTPLLAVTAGVFAGVSIALWWLIAWVFSTDRGIGFRDEGLYLLAADPPSPTARWVTPFGWHTAPFFDLVGHDVARLRTFSIWVLVLTGALLGWTIGRRLTDDGTGRIDR